MLSGTPTNSDVGTHDLTLTVTDSGTLSDSQKFTITVADVNDPPVLTTASSLTFDEDDVSSAIGWTASDIDGDSLTLALGTAMSGTLTDLGDGTYNYAPNPDFNGSDSFTVSVTDGLETVEQTVTVTVNAVDDRPVFTSSVDTVSVDENSPRSTVIYSASATDVDGDTLVYSLSGADASFLSIHSSTGTVKLKSPADYEAKEAYQFTVTASDGSLTDSVDVTLNITDVNDLPVFASSVDTISVDENSQ